MSSAKARAAFEPLAQTEVEHVVDEACRVLERSGVRVENADAAGLLGEAGAEARQGRHRIPEGLVRSAIETAPSRVVLFDRDGHEAADLSGLRVHFDPGSSALNVLDGETGRRRPAVTDDLVALARLVDGLPHYAVQSTALVASDVPEAIADRFRLYVALVHGRKPVVTGTFRADGLAPMRDMLAAVRGGSEALRARPLAVFDCCPTSPLTWSDLTAQALVDCARAGLPANLVSVPMLGATAPVTLRDAVVQHCAENLSGLVVHQLAAPGAPVLYGGAPSAFDMRRGSAPMSAPESLLLNAAAAQVGRRLGLPTHGYLGLSDAKTPDYQAGLESGVGATFAALAGINLVSGPGLLDYLLTQSLDKLLLDHEACGVALRLARGIERREGDAASLIAAVAEAGTLLSHDHTRKHFRAEMLHPSKLLDRETYADWEAAGGATAAERSRDECRRRLAAEPTESLPADLAAELRGIVGL